MDYTLKQGKMDHPVLKLKKPVEGCLGIKCLVITWTVLLCVWIKLVMVQKVGLLRLYGYAFELINWSKILLDFLEWGWTIKSSKGGLVWILITETQ